MTTELKRFIPAEIVVVGGTGAVSATVANQLTKLTKKFAQLGADRFATSQLVIRNAFTTAATVFVPTALDFPDALSASAAGGSSGASVVLVDGRSGKKLDAKPAGLLKSLKVKDTLIAGGTGVVNTTIENELKKSTTVKRFVGNNRFETGQLINRAASRRRTVPSWPPGWSSRTLWPGPLSPARSMLRFMWCRPSAPRQGS